MDHPKQPTFGYLRRSSTILLPPSSSTRPRSPSPSADAFEEEEDPSTTSSAPSVPGEVIFIIHHVVFSPTYRAPQLLIQAHSRKTFSPLSLPLLISLNLVRPPSSSSALCLPSDATSIPLPNPTSPSATTTDYPSSSSSPPPEFPDDDDEADFPLLAQAEHPSTGEGVWALHPCHLQEALEEVIKHGESGNEEGGSGGLRWLESWLMLVGTVVDMRWRS
ncbi:hypothetical protein BDY24DRAFT_384189 [Mrakia frigida]|uniref:uncharacterized protein n=1 Tax=Mrakia frigida TaxID=29902 RepID=UPI003FCC1604